MLIDAANDDIEADFEILEAIGAHVDAMIERLLPLGVIQKTLRRWLAGHAGVPDEDGAQECVMAMAADLEMFTPSASGRTMVDRYLKTLAPDTPDERQAVRALGAASFHLVRIVGRERPGCVQLKDLVTGDGMVLLDERMSVLAEGIPTAMRLCPLESGRYALISPLFAMDEALLDEAMTFVRHGRPLGTGHRCAASLYRNVARRGFMPIPQHDIDDLDEIDDLDDETYEHLMQVVEKLLPPVYLLGVRWAEVGGDPEVVSEARRMTSEENLIDALGCFAEADYESVRDGLQAAFEQIAALQVETMVGRARAGVDGAADMLDRVATEIVEYIAQGKMEPAALDLLNRLRQRTGFSESAFFGAKNPGGNASAAADIDRVIQRIQALRAKTADRGCTEAEAMAAAVKVSELLARHDLTLDEVSVRQSDCEGVSVSTGRKRSAPVDSCAQAVAAFCDCRVWWEKRADGELGFVMFGLKTDVAAARFLHDLIEVTFDTESATFKRGAMYQALRGGNRRTALNSFQIGLASGISSKLGELKAARQAGEGRNGEGGTGFDLVTVKHAVLDDEIDRLGLHFTSRAGPSSRYVLDDAYQAGKVAGAMFEPAAAVEG